MSSKRGREESASEILVRNCCTTGISERRRRELAVDFAEHIGNIRTSREVVASGRFRYFFAYTWDGVPYKYMRTQKSEQFVITHAVTGEHFADMRTRTMVDSARVIGVAKQLQAEEITLEEALRQFEMRWWPFLLARGAFSGNDHFRGILD